MRAGFGIASISPVPPVHLAGFGDRTEPVTQIHDDLQARALYLSDGENTLCLVVCDLLGMSPVYSRPVREAIAAEIGATLDGVLVACTHTHQGPSAIAGTEAIGWPAPEGYAQVLEAGCVKAASQAASDAIGGTVRYGRAPLPSLFAFNRRGGAYEEPWFAVLDVLGDDGSRLGVVANLGIHPVLLGPHWRMVSTDWVGPFRGELESDLGGTAIELTGALGDINPTPPQGTPGASYEPWASADDTNAYGRRLADVVAAAAEAAQPLDPALAIVRAETKEIPVGGTAIAALHGEPTMLVEFVEWQIGDVRVVSIPGEGFHLLGQEISKSRADRVLLAGIAPSWHGYLPYPWGEGYEEGVSFGEGFVSEVCGVLLESPPG